MKRILGLDLGTTSIGWALVNEGENKDERSEIIRLGVRVNPLSADEKSNFEKGKPITTNAARTQKHGMRINLQRYRQRRDNLVECMKEHGIIDDDTPLFELGNRTTFQTYRARAKAVIEKISLEEFARVLLMINKKRGYKSNRKAKDTEEGELIDGMDVAKKLHDENLTPGQYLMMLQKSGKNYRPAFYRSDLQDELDRIWNKQREFYPEILTDELKKEINGLNGKQCSAVFYNKKNITTAKNSGKDAYQTKLNWRNDCLLRKIDIEKVAYVICSLCSDINASSQKLAMISDRSKELYFGNKTIGQYLMELLDNNPNASLTNITFYRQDYIDEFNAIWECQAKYHKELTPELKREIADNIIFFQRDLKSSKPLVSYCEFEHAEKEINVDGKTKKITIGSRVCPRSSPLFQTFKIWQVLNNIKVKAVGKKRRTSSKQDFSALLNEHDACFTDRLLEPEEKNMLFEELSIKSKLSKREVLKMLFDSPDDFDINYREIDGNRTMSAIYSACREIISQTGNGEYDFDKMRASDVKSVVTEIFEGLGYSTNFLSFNPLLEGKELEKQTSYRLWHLLYSYAGDKSVTGNDALLNRIGELCGFEREYARILANVSLIDDYGSLSAKAIRNILPYMMDGTEYSTACQYAGYKHSVRSMTKEELEAKEYADHMETIRRNSLRNPVVEKILNQLVHVVNGIIDTYGKPDEIRIELARNLKQSREDREEQDKNIRKATAEQEAIRKILETEFHIRNVTKNDILRYRLYEELKMNGYKTLYSNTYIPREDLFSKKFDIEHIIPKARLFDDSFSNKTLEARDVNIEKSNKTAYDFVAERYDEKWLDDYERRVEELFKQKIISKTKRNKLLMREADIPEDFLSRDLNDSQYIARKAREMLESIVPEVVTTTGAITKRLREDWKLVDVMKELNWSKYEKLERTEIVLDRDGKPIKRIKGWTKRNDHRHHAMDALTIAFTKRAMIQYLNNLNARNNKGSSISGIEKTLMSRDEHGKLLFIPPIQTGMFREEAKRHLESILVSIKAKNKVMTKNVNKTKSRNGDKKKVQLTPRGQLHNETVYGKIEQYHTEIKKVDGKFTEDVVMRVANKRIREALYARLAKFDHDPKKAFTGKNSLEKNPVWIDKNSLYCVPEKVKLVTMKQVFTIRKAIDSTLNIDKVIDVRVREILRQRLEEYGGNAAKAFSNLEENPIWLNKEKGIAIKRVKISGISNGVALREKHDVAGRLMLDEHGKTLENDYVSTSNNHHIAFFTDAEGNLQEHIVSFYEATARAVLGYPVIDRYYNKELGWKYSFSIKQNEYFVFPNEDEGFYPNEIDLIDEANAPVISRNLYRVQKFSTGDYVFRHHLETNVESDNALKDVAWKRITSINKMKGIVKVRVNHIGKIVFVGEY
ncbi:MAG: type II CRISPR RNA-guided endonuclease Cas9 [Prevotella sp.]|uniref:type II CRISPR RNA-guided endonuclease Cas9 n=1 Tax=Prevotella sp. TaxID=59823 RepID=UPI002A2B8EB6|nr:type II CRISPR RNA-guided endonuclease Cas9 [Prevotella sp.]MDD7317246.1 type II CRISPR RNA-guided endonuclease Cas9 [Prevotellaceae bacterium]MDY4019850.1 type II CRISPR RNA-guided endonuclease Cas9 [Prevotella sp.]